MFPGGVHYLMACIHVPIYPIPTHTPDDSKRSVDSGLGVAFDTTLLALVTSIFIMFPTSSLQKAEEDYLARVDDYCQRQFVSRLEAHEPASPATDGLAAWGDKWADALLEALERRGSRSS